MNDKGIYLIIPLLFVFLLPSCDFKKTISSSDKGEKHIYIIESSPNNFKSNLIIVDKDLNIKNKKEIKAKSIARGFKNIDANGKNIFITTEHMKLSEMKKSNYIVKYDINDDKVNFIKVPDVLADTVSCESVNVYTTFNWNSKCTLYKSNLQGDTLSRYDFKEPGLSVYTKIIDDKLYAMYSTVLGNNDYSVLCCFDKDTLSNDYLFDMDKKVNMSAKEILKKGNFTYYVGSFRNEENGKGCMLVHNEKDNTYKLMKMDLDAKDAFIEGDDIFIFASSRSDDEPKKGEIYRFDINKNKLYREKTIDRTFSKVEKVNDSYILLKRNKLMLIDKHFCIIKEITLDSEFNLDMIVA